MKLRVKGANQTVLVAKDREIFFSYETPVAGWLQGFGIFKTDKHYSPTTTRHINAYFGKELVGKAQVVSQEWIDSLTGEL